MSGQSEAVSDNPNKAFDAILGNQIDRRLKNVFGCLSGTLQRDALI